MTFEDLPIFVDRGRSRDLSPCRYGHLDISWRSTRSKGERRRSCKLRPEKRSEEHTSELQSLMRISYAVFCLKKKNNNTKNTTAQITKLTNQTMIQHTLYHAFQRD